MDNCKEMQRIIHKECAIQGVINSDQIRYIVATAQWETNHVCKPVREAYWLDEEWRKKHLRYYPYYGRGYCQLTWQTNYAKFGNLLGIDLVRKPDLALEPQYAVKILVIGMRDGLFTGLSLKECMYDDFRMDFDKGRQIINGTDKADVIASMAKDVDLRLA